MKEFIDKVSASLLNLFFTNRCAGCDKPLSSGEHILCIRCLGNLPETGFHLLEDNPVEKIFFGRIPFHAATACYFFHKGAALQHIIHEFKYHNREDIAHYMGNQIGRMLTEATAYSTLDCIVPVPLYYKKEVKRGYNQSTLLSQGIAEILHLPVISHAVKRIHPTGSQTHKSRLERWENVKEVFRLTQPGKVQGRHLLLVDDVITTGATIEACAQSLLQIPDVKVSIAALAIAGY